MYPSMIKLNNKNIVIWEFGLSMLLVLSTILVSSVHGHSWGSSTIYACNLYFFYYSHCTTSLRFYLFLLNILFNTFSKFLVITWNIIVLERNGLVVGLKVNVFVCAIIYPISYMLSCLFFTIGLQIYHGLLHELVQNIFYLW
jgi:hypothetical protein